MPWCITTLDPQLDAVTALSGATCHGPIRSHMSQTSRVRLGRVNTSWGPWLQGPRARGQAHTSDHLLCTACVLAGERGASVTAPDTDIVPEASFREKVLLFCWGRLTHFNIQSHVHQSCFVTVSPNSKIHVFNLSCPLIQKRTIGG